MKTSILFDPRREVQLISHSYVDETEEAYIKNIFTKTLDLQKNDKLFIYPECKIPRFKLKTVLEKYNCSLVRDRDKANKFIISKEDIMLIIKHDYYYGVNSQLLYDKIMLGCYFSDLNSIISASVRDSIRVLNSNLLISFNTKNGIWGYNSKYPKEHINIYNVRNDVEFQFLLANSFYSQQSLLSLVNADSILSNSQYETLCVMLESSDVKDNELAVEMLANFDYELSASNILLLLAKYNGKIWSTKNWRHVNFRGMLQFYKIDNPRHFNTSHVIPKLKSLNLFSAYHAKRVFDQLVPSISKYTGYDGIEVKEFGFDDDSIASLAENKLDPTDAVLYAEEDVEIIKPRL